MSKYFIFIISFFFGSQVLASPMLLCQAGVAALNPNLPMTVNAYSQLTSSMCAIVDGRVTFKLCGANAAQRSLRPNERLVR